MEKRERINFEISTFEFKIKGINTRINQLQDELKITVAKEMTPMNVGLIESIAISLKELITKKKQNEEFIECLKQFLKEE